MRLVYAFEVARVQWPGIFQLKPYCEIHVKIWAHKCRIFCQKSHKILSFSKDAWTSNESLNCTKFF